VPLFGGITSDLFPGIELPKPDYQRILEAVHTLVAQQGLQPVPAFIAKVLELYEMILVRHGLMVVGLPY
jgi:dynein heavy chain